MRTLVTMQEEIQREYGKIAAVTVGPPYVNGAFRAAIGASFGAAAGASRDREEQPTFDPQVVWQAGGTAPVDAGIEGETVWIHEDAGGREIERGVFEGEIPELGAEVSRSPVDGRPWLLHRVERAGRRLALHLRKGGEPDPSPLARHLTAPPVAGP